MINPFRQRWSQRARIACFAFLISILFSPLLGAEDIVVVCHQNAALNDINRQDVANLFLGLSNSSFKPYDQKNKKLQSAFYDYAADLSLASVRAHWAKRVFTGRGRPPAIVSLEQTGELISTDPLAITYVPANQVIPGVKILLRLNAEKNSE